MAPKDEDELTGEAYWLSVIARGLALICLQDANLKDADIGTKANLLSGLGLNRRDIAKMLKTTEETVRVSMRTKKSRGRSKGAKGKAEGR